jgi:hypothetical protein
VSAQRALDYAALHAFIKAVPDKRLQARLVEEAVEGVRRGYNLRQLIFGFPAERYTGVAYGSAPSPFPISHAPEGIGPWSRGTAGFSRQPGPGKRDPPSARGLAAIHHHVNPRAFLIASSNA